MRSFKGRIGLQQRVLPSYRVPFVELLSKYCEGGLSVFSGQPLQKEGIKVADTLQGVEQYQTKNLHLKDPSSHFYFCWQKDFINWLISWNPDILILETNPRYLSSYKAIRWMHRHTKRVVGWGLGVPRPGNRLEKFIRSYFLNLFDGVIAYSTRAALEYRKLGLENVYLAYNSVVPKPSWNLPKRSLDSQQPSTVLFVGRLQHRKRVDMLIKACHMMPESDQPRLEIVGEGPALKDLISLSNEIYPKARFPGAIYGKDLAQYFLSADLFVLPGTGGLAIQEAMSYGLPVIVAKGDGTQDDLVTAENGWQIPPGDLDRLSEVLLRALRDKPGLGRKGEESYRIVSDRINVQEMVKVFIDAFNEISTTKY